MTQISNRLAANEKKVLAPYAALSSESRGRVHDEPAGETRLAFQKDRDRIIHSKAFRRLKDKTQVFVAHGDDHNRNRLTHTLEVAQVSRDLARMLGLNEDLAEAIALAHDLGHTPFGHAGETALDECLRRFKEPGEGGANSKRMRFEHNAQSKRVVEELEHVYPGFVGLNLSIEVLEGLMKHETSWDKPGDSVAVRPSLEAQIVNLADEIAYQNHDVDDGLRGGFFNEEDLAGLDLWRRASELVQEQYGEIKNQKIRRARTVSKMIGFMMRDVYEETLGRIERHGVKSLANVYACSEPLVGFSEELAKGNLELKNFLSKRLYFSDEVLKHSKRGQQIITALFDYYLEHFDKRPVEETDGSIVFIKGEDAVPDIRDFIAGMTDHFAEQTAADLQLEF